MSRMCGGSQARVGHQTGGHEDFGEIEAELVDSGFESVQVTFLRTAG